MSTIGFPASVAPEPTVARRVNRRSLMWALLAISAVAISAVGGTIAGTSTHPRPVVGPSSSHTQAHLSTAATLAVSRGLGADLASYRLARTSGGFIARNARQGLTASFGARGATVTTSDRAHASITLRAIGSGAALHAVGLASPLARGNRVEYRRGGATEWFANGPAGVEQGFTIQTKPTGATNGALTLALGLSGTLMARPGTGGGLVVTGAGGKAVLHYGDLSVTDARGRTLPAHMAVKRGRVLISVDARGATYPLRVDPLIQDAELTAADGGLEDDLGDSVAVSGSTIVVGAPQHTVNSHNEAGAVYVFTKPASGEWENMTQTAELTANDAAENDALGVSVGVSASGSTIAAGASRHGGEAGAVYVFEKPSSGGWKNATQTAELTVAGGAGPDQLGHSVAVSGSTIVAGAPGEMSYQGAVYVFTEPISGVWENSSTPAAELTASDGAADDSLDAVAISESGSTIVAAAAGHKVGGDVKQGAVYVFSEPVSGVWKTATQTAELTAGDGAANDELGAVAISESGSTIVAGAAGHKVNGVSEAGAAYVFTEPVSGSWETTSTPTAELTATDAGPADFLGGSVAVSGSTIVAGAAFHNTGGHHWQGAAYAFSKPASSNWENATQTAELTAADGAAGDELGWTVAASGTTIVAGATGRMINGNNDQGAAYVLPFALPTVSIVTPADDATYPQGQTLTADFTCTAAAGSTLKSGTAGCSGSVANGAAIDTSVPGSYTFTVTATDTDGHTGTATSSYTVSPKATGTEPAPETPPSSTTATTSTTATSSSTPGTGTSVSVATSPKAVEELLQGCSSSPLVLNDVYIQGSHVFLSGSAAKSLVGKKVKILFNEGKQVATATVEANGQYTTTAPLPPAKIRDNLNTRYTAEIGKLRSVHLKLVRRLLLEPPKASGTTITLAGQLTLPLTKPIAPVTVEQQLECGKTTVAKTFTPAANGHFHITLTVPANAKAAIFRLTSKVAANKRSVTHGFTTFSLPLPVAIG